MIPNVGYYRSKPVSVRAIQWQGKIDPSDLSASRLTGWFDQKLPLSHIRIVRGNLQVVTDNGTAVAKPGDWIVYWAQTSKTFEVIPDEHFRRRFDVDQRTARIFGWRDETIRK